MYSYQNGTYIVKISSDGTKERIGNFFIPEFPESIDLKVTNRCNAMCGYCHEKSVIGGENADFEWISNILSSLPAGTEIAIGGGNPLEVSKELTELFEKHKRIIFNVTVNSRHLGDVDIIPNAFGVSYNRVDYKKIVKFAAEHKNSVVHLIAGLHDLSDLAALKRCERILILGYKQFGRGVDFYNKIIEKSLYQWKIGIGRHLACDSVLAFDNLAIEQLKMQRFFTKEHWDELYMGDDGKFTMYIDAVERKFAKSSTSERRNCNNLSIKEMFQCFHT